MNNIPTATLLVSYGAKDTETITGIDALTQLLSEHLKHPVLPCLLDQPGRPLLTTISSALTKGAVKLVVLPLFLSPADYQDNAVAEAITYASRRWPFVQFHVSPALNWQEWLRVVGARVIEAQAELPEPVERQETAIVLAGHGDVNPDVNSDLAKLARLFYESYGFGWVDVAYVEETTPSVPEMMARQEMLGAKQIIVLPYLLTDGTVHQQLQASVATAKEKQQVPVTVAPCLSPHPTLVDVLLARHEVALADRSLLPVSWDQVMVQLQSELNSHERSMPGQPAPDEDEFQQLNEKISAILPPRYQGRLDKVSAAPMTSAELVFDEQGEVAWDQVFGVDDPDNPFCELALAGGPAHRGELLEAVAAEDCLAEPGKYAAALTEIERGISMITGLPVVESTTSGWIGIQCDSEEMAIWLVRAIIVENVMVRREGETLYLPVGPHYTLKNEVKSIVTVTAKTCHYWIEHMLAQRLLSERMM
ncbi:MAG: CbiX/SirB N-terminal domain-containing protein [Chloroflexota bacterium]